LGRNWKLLTDDEFNGSYDKSIWKEADVAPGPGGYCWEDDSQSLKFVNGKIEIRGLDASGAPGNSRNLPGCGLLITKQK